MNTHDDHKPTAILIGGQTLGTPTVSRLARLIAPTIMHDTPDDGGSGDGTDTEGGDAEGTDTAADGTVPEGGDAEGTDAEGSYTLPEDFDSLDETALQGLFDSLESEIQAVKDTPKEELTALLVAEGKAKRDAQTRIVGRVEEIRAEQAQLKADLESLDDTVVAFPTAPAASDAKPAAKAAAAKPAQQPTAATAVRERATVSQPDAARGGSTPGSERRSLLAAVAETQTAWVSQGGRNVGEVVSWRDLVNNTRPTGGPGSVRSREDAVLAAARVGEGARNFDFELTDSTSQNERAINAAMEAHRDARIAASGNPTKQAALCDPATIIRTAAVCGTDAMPFQGALVGMTAQSGNQLKFQYRQSTSLSEWEEGIGVWDATKQAAIDPADPETWKPCIPIPCPEYDDAEAKEITACYELDAFTELSSPEAEADFVQAKDRAWARFTEGWYLREVDEFLHYVSFNGETGALPDTIEAILTAVVSGQYGERLEEGTFVTFGSPGVLAAASIDASKRAFGDLSTSVDQVRTAIGNATGTSYVQLHDLELASDDSVKASPFASFGTVGAASATPMPRLSQVGFTLRVLDPSAFVRWDTGEAVFGDQITLDQARRNKRGFFQRIFGGVMKPGCAPGYRIDITLTVDGSRGGFVAPGYPSTGFESDGTPFVATPAS